MSEEAIRRLQSRQWPGNIRQLEHTIEKALILCDSQMLKSENFDMFDDNVAVTTEKQPETLENMERQAIAAAIKQNAGNLTEAARQLGITRQTIYNKIKKYGL